MRNSSIRHRRIGSRSIVIGLLAVGLLTLALHDARAQTEYLFPAGEAFDQAIPSPGEFLGYSIGTFHTRHDRIVAYMQELARLSDRASYQEIGMTYEHRVMPVLTVTTPANHARLEAIRREHLASLDPNASPVTGLPAIVHLGYGVHGNEPSSAEAAMLTAYWLVAGTGPEVERYRSEGIFHIEPVLNPDGRDRHTHWANMNRAEPLVADPYREPCRVEILGQRDCEFPRHSGKLLELLRGDLAVGLENPDEAVPESVDRFAGEIEVVGDLDRPALLDQDVEQVPDLQLLHLEPARQVLDRGRLQRAPAEHSEEAAPQVPVLLAEGHLV